MKRTIYIALAFLLSISISGCRTTTAVQETPGLPRLLQDRAKAITAAGGITALGIAKSTLLSSALDKSQADAQAKLILLITSKLDTLKDNLKDEIGEENIAQFNELFYTAKDFLHNEINNIIPSDIKYETISGVTTAYSLLIMDPEAIAKAFPSDSKQFKHIYTRFRASRAFAQMKKEIKQYEIWGKGHGASQGDL